MSLIQKSKLTSEMDYLNLASSHPKKFMHVKVPNYLEESQTFPYRDCPNPIHGDTKIKALVLHLPRKGGL